MAIYGPAPGLEGRPSELWVLNRWLFNFCVRSTPYCGGPGFERVLTVMGSQQHDSFCVGGTSPYRTGERVSNWILTSRQRHGLTSGQSNTVINQYTLYGSSLVTSTNAVQAQMCIHSKTNVDMAAKVIFDVTQKLYSISPDTPKFI